MRLWLVIALFFVCVAPAFSVQAHEVYVLSSATIEHDLAVSSPNPFDAFYTNTFQFFFWGLIAFVVVTTVFFASITHRLEQRLRPYLLRLRPWAGIVARVTLGLCLIASTYNHALFGPELPLSDFGSYARPMEWALYLAGALLVCGWWVRFAAVLALVIFAAAAVRYGVYLFTYANYLGEILLALLLTQTNTFSKKVGGGGQRQGTLGISLFTKKYLSDELAFLALRVGFGVSIAFAAIYAKFIHSNLALDVVTQYNLTNIFQFDPLFIVLGACIIEVLMGVFFIIGFEVRHTALFFLFWLTLSLLYFGELVWPHLVLVGVNIALFMYGYDRLTIEGRYFTRGKLQPFL